MAVRRIVASVLAVGVITLVACSGKEDLKPIETQGFPLAQKKGLGVGGGGGGSCNATNCTGCCDFTATPATCRIGDQDDACGINGNPCQACGGSTICNSTAGRCE